MSISIQNAKEGESITIMVLLKKMLLVSACFLTLSCGVVAKDPEPHQARDEDGGFGFSLVSNQFFLSNEEEQCVATYPNLKAEHLKEGVTISGVTGTSTFTFPNCSETIRENCIATAEFRAGDMAGIAGKLALGQTVGGVVGTAAIQTQSNCNAANQTDCIATTTYPTMDLSEQGNNSADSLTSTNFSTKVTSNASFEYWDVSGNRNVSTGDADLTTNNIKSGVSLLGTSGPTDPLDCASISVGGTWIMVPGDPDYGTNDFCVMKYEAKCSVADGKTCVEATHSPLSQASNTPWVNIDQQDSITECASLGKGYHLITNDEWMTIASNIAGQNSNWSSGTVGTGSLYRGHSDDSPTVACPADANDANAYVEDDAGTDCTAYPNNGTEDDEATQRRTHTLSNGQVIWDLAGNAREWVSYFNNSDKPYDADDLGPVDSWREHTDIDTFGSAMSQTDLVSQAAIDGGWTSTESIGRYRAGAYASNSGGGGLQRGGRFDVGIGAGVFTARLFGLPTFSLPTLGFRCAISVP